MRLVLIVRLVLIAGIALAARSALAQSCDVHVMRAPDKVRAMLEARLRAERQCATSLVLRIVPTKTGLYLLAHAPSGAVHEMVVRDAQTAIDLVVLWASRGDAVAAPVAPLAPPPIAPPPLAPPPIAPPPPAIEPERARLAPPGITENLDRAPRASGAGTWLSFSGIVGDNLLGGRIEVDVLEHRGLTAGIALEAALMKMIFEPTVLSFEDVRVVAAVGYTIGRRPWQLRVHAGAGIVHTAVTGSTPQTMSSVDQYPIGEAGVYAMFGFGARWAVSVGPMLTVYAQSYRIPSTGMLLGSRDYDVSLAAALRRSL